MFRALYAHHQAVKIVLYSIWYYHTCMWPSGAQVERGPVHRTVTSKRLNKILKYTNNSNLRLPTYFLINNVLITLFLQNYVMFIKPRSRRKIKGRKIGEYGNSRRR